MNEQTTSPAETATGHQALHAKLKELLQVSDDLRVAMTRRDAEAIMSLAATQERLTTWFKTYANGLAQPGLVPPAAERGEMASLASGIKRLQRTNRALARAFLSVINRAVARISGTGEPGECLYGASGRPDAATPVLVRRKG